MRTMVNLPVEHRGFEQLHRRTHADKALAVFLQRQPDAFLLTSSVERFDESAVVSDALEIVSGADLAQTMNDRLEIDRLARRCLQQTSVAPGSIVAALFSVAIEQAVLRQPKVRQHRAVVRPI